MKKVDKNKTRRKERGNNRELWDKFDSEILDKPQSKLECLYRDSKVCEKDTCNCCNGKLAYVANGFLVCSNKKCGTLYKDVLEHGAEWRYYGADDNNIRDPTRCGMPINPLLKESSYGCKVSCYGQTTYEMKKIKRYTEWQSMPYKEKSQYDEFQRIKIMSKISGIPKIMVDEALRQHKKISEMKTFRGCNRDGVIAASVYIACRIHNYPRTAKEIATIFHLDNSDSTRGCKNAMHLLNNMEREMIGDDKTKLYRTKPTSFIERYCSRLNINKEITKLCLFVALNIQMNDIIPENTPHSVAAGIVYFVSQSCNLNISKKDVNTCSEISEVTINKCYKKLYKIKGKLIPSIILKKYSH
jgi:transcription initiation factor TFIIB